MDIAEALTKSKNLRKYWNTLKTRKPELSSLCRQLKLKVNDRNTELQRLWTEVDVRNVPSQKMLEKCGYTREGLIRQGKMVNTWCDYYIYGIFASDMLIKEM